MTESTITKMIPKYSKFYLIGDGYIAPKHYNAILSVKGELKGICDIYPKDNLSANKIVFNKQPKYYNNSLDMLRDMVYEDNSSDTYVIIATPNNTHYELIQTFENYNIICEKPLVTNYNDFVNVIEIMNLNKVQLYQISQTRFIRLNNLKESIINIDYNVIRGNWYFASWKNNPDSGGILYNIAIHPIDCIISNFGSPDNIILFSYEKDNIVFQFIYKNSIINFNVGISNDSSKESVRNMKIKETNKKVKNIDLFKYNSHNDVYSNIILFNKHSRFNVLKYSNNFHILYRVLEEIKIQSKYKGRIL